MMLPPQPATPWSERCSMRLNSGALCGAPRVALATGHGSSAAVLYAAGMVSAPRIVMACLNCDFADNRPDAGPPRFVAYVRRGGA